MWDRTTTHNVQYCQCRPLWTRSNRRSEQCLCIVPLVPRYWFWVVLCKRLFNAYSPKIHYCFDVKCFTSDTCNCYVYELYHCISTLCNIKPESDSYWNSFNVKWNSDLLKFRLRLMMLQHGSSQLYIQANKQANKSSSIKPAVLLHYKCVIVN